jgi:hypothetical protein
MFTFAGFLGATEQNTLNSCSIAEHVDDLRAALKPITLSCLAEAEAAAFQEMRRAQAAAVRADLDVSRATPRKRFGF